MSSSLNQSSRWPLTPMLVVPVVFITGALACWLFLRVSESPVPSPLNTSGVVQPNDPEDVEAPVIRQDEQDLSWVSKFPTQDDPKYGALYVSPTCKVCGRELVCPDHLNRLPTPGWALDESLPEGVKNAFWALAKDLEKLRKLNDQPEKQTMMAMLGTYTVTIELDKWMNGESMNPGLDAGFLDETDFPSPIPNMQGEEPGDPGWEEYVGCYTGTGPISWHYTEYPLWRKAFEIDSVAFKARAAFEKANGPFAEHRNLNPSTDHLPSFAMGQENWDGMMADVEHWYAWACVQFEEAKNE